MTPEQSAAREVLAAAIDCFDFENLLGGVPITHDAFDDLRDACTPENVRHLLAALDEAQQDAARYRFIRDCPATCTPCPVREWLWRRPFGTGEKLDNVIDGAVVDAAARASTGGAA